MSTVCCLRHSSVSAFGPFSHLVVEIGWCLAGVFGLFLDRRSRRKTADDDDDDLESVSGVTVISLLIDG